MLTESNNPPSPKSPGRMRGGKIILLVAVALLACVLLGWWTLLKQEASMRAHLLSETRIAASAINCRHVEALTASEADLASPDYQRLKEQLASIQCSHPKIRFTYLFGRRPDNSLFFFVDSEPPDSKDYSPPGQLYTEASEPFRAIFATGDELVEGPVTDRWGTWFSALVPVADPRTGKLLAVFGMDIEASDWRRELAIRMAERLAVFLMFVVPLAVFLVLRQKNAWNMYESRQYLSDIIQFFPDAILVIDKQGKVSAWNRALEELSGVKAEEMLGKGDYEYALPFYGERRPILIDLVTLPDELIEGNYSLIERRGGTLFAEAYIHHARKGKLYFQGTAVALHNSSGEIIGAIESFRDLSERKRVEERAAYLASFPQLNPNPVLEVDSSGRVTFSNPATLKVLEALGMGREEVGVFLPADLHKILGNPHKEEETTFWREIRIQERVFSESIYFLPRPVGGARIFVYDITDHKRAEEEVCFKNIILATQQECSIDGILVVDDNAAIISCNQRFAEIWNIPPKVLETGDDAPLLDFVTNQLVDQEGFLARVRYLYAHREEKSREELTLKDGRVLERYSAPMISAEGKYHGRVWYFRDITERKRSDDALHQALQAAEESAQRLEFVLKGSNDATWEWDLISNEGVINTRYYEMMEYGPGEVEVNFEFFLKTLHPDDVAELLRRLQDHLEGKTSEYEAQCRMITKSGKIMQVMDRGRIVKYDEAGRPTKAAGVITDITEMKRLNEEINRIHNLEAIGLLAGGLAHDFNNVLNIIYGNISFARMLAEGNTAIAEPLTDAEGACERAKELGVRLHAFSQGSAPVKETIALPGLVEEIAAALGMGANILSGISAPEELRPVEADPRQIRQVFEHLLTNAKEALADGGTIKIHLENYEVGDRQGLPLGAGPYVRVTVEDDGKGIPEENLPRIFDPYFSTKDTYSQKGLGLGLSICHAILKRHRGHISVESTWGIGTRVSVYLPAAAGETR